jgi:type IX secretion system PorP/SprF family membrane protein
MKWLLKIFFLSLIPLNLLGQINPVSSQYVLNPLIINPSYAGSRGALNIAAFYRKQWVRITGSPETITLAGDASLFDRKLGIGLVITDDKIGVTRETHLSTSYSYKVGIGSGTLSFGLGAGLITTNTKYSDLIVLDPGDESYLTDSHVFVVPEFSFGMNFAIKNYFLAVSVPKILQYDFNFARNKYEFSINPGRNYLLMNTGYLFTVSPKVKLQPSALLTFSPESKLLFDVNLHLNLYDRFWAGLSYRNTKSLIALLQFAVVDQFKIAYSYDFDMGTLGRYSSGSHEIMLRYEFRYKVSVVNPLVF